MRAQRFAKWLLVLSFVLLLTACQPGELLSVPSAAISSIGMSAPALGSFGRTGSGVYLTASISPLCVGPAQTRAECVRPYMGEFVVTELNGAEVVRVMTNQLGQAIINLPPGTYLVGARTENIYPLAAPIRVSVLSDRYAYISISLDSGLQWQ
jgi:hypothetical protein